MKKIILMKREGRNGYVLFLKYTHVKLYHTNAKWHIVVIKLCPHVHRTVKPEGAREMESDLQNLKGHMRNTEQRQQTPMAAQRKAEQCAPVPKLLGTGGGGAVPLPLL